jgi:glyoxylase-like metal-dependent hydrolase (beta-lactamase superfamily II)
MSNSFPERKKTIVLEAIETLFNGRDYVAAGRFQSPTDIQHSAHIQAGPWSTRADKEPASNAEVRAGGHPCRERLRAQSARVWINGGRDMSSPGARSRNVLKRNAVRFAVALLVALASFVAGPNPALAAAPQHHDQVPGFYRLKVGDLEVTALYDGTGVFDQHWLNGTKATMDGVGKALHEDPHMLDEAVAGFLVNTGKQLLLVDAGSGTWWGGGALGRLAGSLRSAGYAPEEVDMVLITHLHSDHVGGLTSQDGRRVFPNADVYVAKVESDFWLSPEIAANAPKDAQPFFQSAQAIAAPYIKAGKWHTFSGSEPIVDGMQLVPLPGHTPGHTGYEFSSKGQNILFLGDIVHAVRVQLQHPEVTVVFDIDQSTAAATRNQLLPKLAREDVWIAGPHMSFPGLGRLRKEGSGYSWAPVVFTDQWDEHAPSPQK